MTSSKKVHRNNPVLKQFKDWRAREGVTLLTAMDILSSIGTVRAHSLYLLCKYGEFDQVVTMEVDPSQYLETDAEGFYDDLIATSLLRKAKFLKTSFDKKQAAFDAFRAAEQQCGRINRRFSSSGYPELPPGGEYVYHTLIRKIHRILGAFKIDDMLSSCAWGPGVTQTVKGKDTSASRKFDVESDITRDAYSLFGEVCQQAYPSWEAWKQPSFKAGNVIITVPKNAKTDRTIAVEPGLNVWLQLGIGKLIRRRLGFAGFNLNSDVKNHRQAYLGSRDDSVATVDFKAASDTISRKLVEDLLPRDWFAVLDAARSHYYQLDGKQLLSEKFSTMGNGFTFELESLIFVSIALALCEKHGLDDGCVSIFGDDLTLPSVLVPELTLFCESIGFTVNVDKTFAVGPFRESCGCYYYNGVAVKPLFLKEPIRNAKDVYRTLNSLRALAHRRNFEYGCDRRLLACYNRLLHSIPESLRFRGPLAGGDSVIHSNLAECPTVRRPDHGIEGYLYSGLPSVPVQISKDSSGLLLARLWRTGGEVAFGNNVPLRAKVRTLLKRNMFAFAWYEFGIWN